MKKLQLPAVIAVSFIASALAGPAKTVYFFVRNSFENDFKHITAVDWDVTPSYAKATFQLNNVKTEAFYKLDGEFIGSSQAVKIDDLPTAAKRNFAKKYGTYLVKEAIKFEGKDDSFFYISAENEKESVILKADNLGVSVYQVKMKK